jgi:Gluconate 2-dehydrogenase subunit 3
MIAGMSDRHIGRRALLQSFFATFGAGYAFPFVAASHPMQHQLADPDKVDAADAQAANPSYKPEFLDAQQLDTLDVLAERIIPGSREAHVAPFLDSLLSVSDAGSQRRFLGSLGAFEMLAVERHQKPWKALTPAQQDELLAEASNASPNTPVRGFFNDLRGWISGAYYSSEVGMRELGWTGQMVFRELPGCDHPEGHG